MARTKMFSLAIIVTLLQFIDLCFSQYENPPQYQNTPLHQTIVNIPSFGQIEGTTDYSSWTYQLFYKFYAIPFGESTSGANRFQPPRPKRTVGIFKATEPKEGCPLGSMAIVNSTNEDPEDCLHLSVFSKNIHGRAPVMIILNDETYYETNRNKYSPKYLMEENVVVVMPQYRTGVLGFISTKTKDIPGNVGILDVYLAIEWTKANIQYFGGNAEQITLVGQSGGAVIAHALTLSPMIKPNMFQQVILQSGSAFAATVIDQNPELRAFILALLLKCSFDEMDIIEHINSCLLKASISDLMNVSVSSIFFDHTYLPNTLGVRLTLNDYFGLLPGDIHTLANSNSAKHLPMIVGVTKHDGLYAVDDEYISMLYLRKRPTPEFIKYDLVDKFLIKMGVEDKGYLIKNLFGYHVFTQNVIARGDYAEMFAGLVDLAGFVIFKGPALTIARQNSVHYPRNTFLYSFDYKGEHSKFGYGDNKPDMPFQNFVTHNDENVYLFPYPDEYVRLNANDTEIAKIMVKLWTSFAQNGVPKHESFEWEPFTTNKGVYATIDLPSNSTDDFEYEFLVSFIEETTGTSLIQYEKRFELFDPKYKN